MIDPENEKIQDLRKPKIVSQRIVAHVLSPTDHIILMSALDEDGLLNVDTVENTIVTRDEYSIEYLLGLLNSKLVSWYCYIFIFNKAVRTMDFDGYYVGKIPVLLADTHVTNKLVSVSKELHMLVPKLSINDIDFRHYVGSYPRVKDSKLEDHYSWLKIHVERKPVLDSMLTGVVTNVFAKEDNDWLIVLADYEHNETRVEKGETLRFRVADKDLRRFLFSSINWAGKKIRKGNILDTILKMPIPKFSKDAKKNIEIMRAIGREYSAAIERYREISARIASLECQTNEALYDMYGLDESEVSMIEEMFGKESLILSLFLKPRELDAC